MNDQRNGGINWTDMTWNPITGCLHGCQYCYARAMARRLGRGFEPAFHPERLNQPKLRRAATRIFVGSNADVFGAWVPPNWIEAVMDVARQCPQHTFQFLTKNPGRLAEFNPWPGNCWLGGTVDVRQRLEPTLDALRAARAPVRFISFEPLNEDMSVPLLAGSVEWIIIGAQTGPGGHQPEREWVEGLLAAARGAHIPVLMKDNLIWSPRIELFPQPVPVQQRMF